MPTNHPPKDGTVPEAATPSFSSAVPTQSADPAADPGTSARAERLEGTGQSEGQGGGEVAEESTSARTEHRSEGIGQTEGQGEGEVAEERASTPPKRRETVSQRMRVRHPTLESS